MTRKEAKYLALKTCKPSGFRLLDLVHLQGAAEHARRVEASMTSFLRQIMTDMEDADVHIQRVHDEIMVTASQEKQRIVVNAIANIHGIQIIEPPARTLVATS